MQIQLDTTNLSSALSTLQPFEKQAGKTLHGRSKGSSEATITDASVAETNKAAAKSFGVVESNDIVVGAAFMSRITRDRLVKADLIDEGANTLWGAEVVVDEATGTDIVAVPKDCEYDPGVEVPKFKTQA